MDKKLNGLGIVAFNLVVLGFLALIFVFRLDVNPLYVMLALALVKWLYVGPKYIYGYAKIVGAEPKWYWTVPGFTEYAIFSPLYSLLSLVSLIAFIVMIVLCYLVGATGVAIPLVNELNVDVAYTNLIWITLLFGFIYNFIVSLGYLLVDRTIADIYFKRFSSFSNFNKNLSKNWAVFTYFVPVVRIIAMNNANLRIDKLIKFHDSRNDREDELK